MTEALTGLKSADTTQFQACGHRVAFVAKPITREKLRLSGRLLGYRGVEWYVWIEGLGMMGVSLDKDESI